MSNSVFASGWHVIEGTQGVDVLMNTGTANVLSGNTNVHWPHTATADARVVSDWVAVDGLNATGAAECSAQYYSVRGHFRADDVTANKNLVFGVQLMNDAGNLFRNVLAWQSWPLPTANTWQSIGFTFTPTWVGKGRWMRVIAYRPNDVNFNLWLDSVEIRRLPPYALVSFPSGSFPIPAGAPTWIPLTPTSPFIEGHLASINGNLIEIHQPGVYQINAHTPISSTVFSGDLFSMRLSTQQASGAARVYHYQSLGVPTTYSFLVNVGMTISHCYTLWARTVQPAVWTPGNVLLEIAHLTTGSAGARSYGTSLLELCRVAE